ncbi:hypothetical protein M2451_002542 [Dysgonomonas sp. PFB1-18]|uniref:hypothetical protein n=1 Tax=unclassified Dysgonomonas TaxID=2630389 RepID=UPI0024736378|nr:MULTISPECIES: hypothetical protein [unclassified Dysgonomonas]MDH6308023.1 hypothetical protein [Dysgonomonas sp. PF1-14]MDH6339562.1 hypothetical protein [Dysgonomonas sp. PF1-16]MDH6381213.1 hypothetical protein [Dysgonomonas sp. PFB1-18]MDH6398425.1 hypothetical protein [Dysgonomonas sp. PF1-23]
MNEMINQIEHIITTLRDSDVYIEHIFMRGGCYKFHLFLKSIYPDAKPYIHQDKDHIATKIHNRLFDIRGSIEPKFEELYSPLKNDDVDMVRSWSFSRNQLLQICECSFCGEPIIYDVNVCSM